LQLQSPTFAAEAPGNFTGDNRQNPPHGKKLSPCPQACEAVASEGEGAKGAMAIDALPLLGQTRCKRLPTVLHTSRAWWKRWVQPTC
jgi:hypothetical protein